MFYTLYTCAFAMKLFTLNFLLLPLVSAQCPHETEGLAAWNDPGAWADGSVPVNGSLVEISTPILLSGDTGRLDGVKIVSGGRLIFDPNVAEVRLVTNHILIEDEGSLEIGSKTCLFDGQAEILLTGMRDEVPDEVEYGFGQKYIGVAPGGSLEIHGASASKVSWTRLATHLSPKDKIFDTIKEGWPNNVNGYILVELDKSGNYLKHTQNLHNPKDFLAALDNMVGDVIALVKYYYVIGYYFDNDMHAIQTLLECKLNITEGSLNFENLGNNMDPYALLVNRADPNNFLEDMDSQDGPDDPDGRSTEMLEFELDGIVFRAQASALTQTAPWKGKREGLVQSYPNDYYTHDMIVQEETGWQSGDRIVVASTDFNMDQVEEFEVVSVDGTKLGIDGHIEYVHYADNYEGVDMRAEVGLLTRNIRIHGEMQEECYTDTNLCSTYDFDNFGGHTKAIEGFAAYNIEGAELYHMGQTTVLGSYPIHFHMAGDTMRDGERTAVQHNSIHNTFSRCVTIHGSHNVDIINNVAHDHYGHCFFLEDGGEKGTYFEHNLGLTTRKGALTPSDTQPSTFWITSPLTTLKYNAAAGSDTQHGVGIWYLFPDEPVGPSAGLGLFAKFEAKSTPIDPFKDNVAHSNGNAGLGLFRRLSPNHGISGCSTYSPKVDPQDRKSELKPITFDGLIAYKNRRVNAILRSTTTEALNFRLSDSQTGVRLVRNMLGGFQRIKNSTIIGESPNIGIPERMNYIDDEGKKTWVMSERSVNWPWTYHPILYGVWIDAEGPSHLEDIKFFRFLHTKYVNATAIWWQDQYALTNGATTSAKGLSFDYSDPDEGYWMYEKTPMNGKADASIMMRDLDGSLTGSAGSSVVQKDMYFSSKSTCVEKPGWNLNVCDEFYAAFYIWPTHIDTFTTFITDTDNNIEAHQSITNSRLSYTVRSGETYVMHWNGTMPQNFDIRMSALEVDDEIIVGFCLPRGAIELAGDNKLKYLFELEDKDVLVEAADLADLSANSAANVFIDRPKDMIYRKFVEDRSRGPEDLTDCIGGLKSLDSCPLLRVRMNKWIMTEEGVAQLDYSDGDCRGR